MQGTESALPQNFINEPKNGKFRLASQKIFLTYPKCPIEPTMAIQTITELTEKYGLDKYMIVQEEHKDGTKHLHAIIQLKKRPDISNSRCFDLGDYHGNYCAVKNFPAAVRYLTKSGKPIANWDFETYLKEQVGHGHLKVDHTEKNNLALTQGVKALVEQGLIPLSQLPQWTRGITEYNNLINRPVEVYSATIRLPLSYNPDLYMERTVDLKDSARRHFWFYGTTGTGKTWTAEHQDLKAYTIPKNNDWVGYAGEQLLILNEFKGEMTPTTLIDIMEGRQQNIKGSSAIVPKSCLLIVTSNYSLRECFHKLNESGDAQLDALERRFTEVKFTLPHPSCPKGRDLVILDATSALKPPATVFKVTKKVSDERAFSQANIASYSQVEAARFNEEALNNN